MGMVSVVGMKMSSRTGEILRVNELIDKVKTKVNAMVEEGRIEGDNKDEVIEMVAIGAIKYSVLKVGTGQNVSFDIEKSVSLEGDSGPYLQYTFARTQSVLAKSQISNLKSQNDLALDIGNFELEIEESDLLRYLYRFSNIVEEAGRNYSPNILADYLFDLARLYNNFYQKHKIIGSEKEDLRLALTKSTGDTLKEGLDLLGINAPERM
jgi:arginyl-tRNA synthetase